MNHQYEFDKNDEQGFLVSKSPLSHAKSTGVSLNAGNWVTKAEELVEITRNQSFVLNSQQMGMAVLSKQLQKLNISEKFAQFPNITLFSYSSMIWYTLIKLICLDYPAYVNKHGLLPPVVQYSMNSYLCMPFVLWRNWSTKPRSDFYSTLEVITFRTLVCFSGLKNNYYFIDLFNDSCILS